uniref:ARAD1D44638p n=1 Tax=Blastobotrys adeninivorans TaxID=409370 RepID=A0A060TI89_BLAAD
MSVPLQRDAYQDVLTKIRGMWQFCVVCQFVSFFGPQLGLTRSDEFDVEIFEEELLGFPSNPEASETLLQKVERGLVNALLEPRFRTGSFQGDLMKIYGRKQYARGTEGQLNETLFESYGDAKIPEKVEVLGQLVRWLSADDRFREWAERRGNTKNMTVQETLESRPEQFRIDPAGFRDDMSTYLLCDDNRLYLREEFAPDLGEGRGRKRRRVKLTGDELREALAQEYEPQWECVCWDRESWTAFVAKIKKGAKKDANQQQLYEYLQGVVEVIEQDQDAKMQAAASRQKARDKIQLVANRKRSSRIEMKQARLRQEEEERQQRLKEEEERLRKRKQEAAQRERERARQQRYLDRLERERQVQEEGIRRSQRARSRQQQESEWVFDCVCGAHGHNYDDGRVSVQCDGCGSWMHVECLGEEEKKDIEKEDSRFECQQCQKFAKQLAEQKQLEAQKAQQQLEAQKAQQQLEAQRAQQQLEAQKAQQQLEAQKAQQEQLEALKAAEVAPRPSAPVIGTTPVFISPTTNQVSVPTSAPAPAIVPIAAPAPSTAPITVPVSAPAPITAPVSAPITAPITAPVPAPVPVLAPITAPVSAPIAEPKLQSPVPASVARLPVPGAGATTIPPVSAPASVSAGPAGPALPESVEPAESATAPGPTSTPAPVAQHDH